MPTIDIRPKFDAIALLFGVGCLVFTISGLWLLFFLKQPMDVVVGLVSVSFFGAGGAFIVVKFFVRKISMRLTPDGSFQYSMRGATFLAWEDVEKIGVFDVGLTKLVGVRLKTRKNYLNAVPEADKNRFTTKLSALFSSFLGTFVAPGSDTEPAPRAADGAPPRGTEDILKILRWNREHYGYDLAFTWADMDRSPEAFAELLEEYRRAKRRKPALDD